MSRAFNSIQQENQQQQQISQQLNYGHQHLQHKYTNIQIVLLIIILIICVICIVYMYTFKRKSNVDQIINIAAERSTFRPNVFKIYDKSTKTHCNRVIMVEPFGWYLWAIRDELFILNSESGARCPVGSMSAIQVFGTQFVETCLALDMNSIYLGYINGRNPVVVPYEIEGTTFTILSAINILVRNYIYFRLESYSNIKFDSKTTTNDINNSKKHTPSDPKNTIYPITIEQGRTFNSLEMNRLMKNEEIVQEPINLRQSYRQNIGWDSLVDGNHNPIHHGRYKRTLETQTIPSEILYKGRKRIMELNPNDFDYPTKRQNAIDSMFFRPRLIEN
uniref:Putative 19kda protein n=1 Tax=Kallithea virus TaxID=1654582 RepID=A0A0F7KLQ6_9VIRU|nr:putative 19kda protein [Kallithea virus]